jgi:hypothetical protein
VAVGGKDSPARVAPWRLLPIEDEGEWWQTGPARSGGQRQNHTGGSRVLGSGTPVRAAVGVARAAASAWRQARARETGVTGVGGKKAEALPGGPRGAQGGFGLRFGRIGGSGPRRK